MKKLSWLQKAYRYYNRKYFKHKLPKDLPVNFSSKLPITTMGWLYSKQKFSVKRLSNRKWEVKSYAFPQVQINNRLKNDIDAALITLLHEMVHLEFHIKGIRRLNHGPRFQKRMRQLAAQGAFNGLW